MRVVPGCPCGEAHRLSDENARKLRDDERRLGPTAATGRLGACWRVPRIFLRCHTWNAAMLPALAAEYGWEPVK